MDIPLGHDLLEIAQAQRKSKIPPNAQDGDLGSKMSPLKQRWPVLRMNGQGYQTRATDSQHFRLGRSSFAFGTGLGI
jgi:hypothetical protein